MIRGLARNVHSVAVNGPVAGRSTRSIPATGPIQLAGDSLLGSAVLALVVTATTGAGTGATLATLGAVAALTALLGLLTLGGLELASLAVDDGVQAQLAAIADLSDLDLDLLADLQDVVHGVDALAAHEAADLRDVQEAVLAGGSATRRRRTRWS